MLPDLQLPPMEKRPFVGLASYYLQPTGRSNGRRCEQYQLLPLPHPSPNILYSITILHTILHYYNVEPSCNIGGALML